MTIAPRLARRDTKQVAHLTEGPRGLDENTPAPGATPTAPTEIPMALASAAPQTRERPSAPHQHPLVPLRSRGFLRFWLAGILSFTGFSIQMLSRGWLMHEMTNSPFLVSMVAASMMLPMLFLSLAGGVLADRFDQARMIVIAEVVMLATFALMAVLVATHAVQPWSLLALSTVNGVVFALNGPARQTVVVNLVPRPHLGAAVGLNMVVFNAAQIIGPAIGGVLLSSLGIEVAFAVSAAFMFPSLALYLTVRPEPAARTGGQRQSAWAGIRSGFAYIASDPSLRFLLLGALVIMLTVMPWQALAPVFAADVLGRGPGGLGAIVLSAGAGALVGTVVVISVGSRLDHDRVEMMAGFAAIGAVSGFALSGLFPLTVIFAGFAGFASAVFMVTNMTVIQLSVPDELRGRVVSVRFLVIGMQPLGMLTMGAAAEMIGPQWAVAGLALIGAVFFGLVQLFARRGRVGSGE